MYQVLPIKDRKNQVLLNEKRTNKNKSLWMEYKHMADLHKLIYYVEYS